MTATWDERIDLYWTTVDDTRPAEALEAMRSLIDERPDGDPDALYEWASVHDYLGMELDAIPFYRAALDRGLSGARRSQAIIQLASSLRNVGEPDAAIGLLREHPGDDITGDAAQAFLALALRDGGHPDEALRTALVALARTLPLYRRAVEDYAKELTDRRDGAEGDAPAPGSRPEDLVAAAWRSEEALLTPHVRNDPERLGRLLADDFTEIGQSGRRWTRDEIIAALVSTTDPTTDASLTDREARLIAPDVVQLSYRLRFGTRISRRSSLWRRDHDELRCIFHQGTPVPA